LVKHELPAVAHDTRLDTIAGFDSLVMVNLVVRLESMVGRELTENELEQLRTVGDIERLLGVASR
jgi:acyl carrier protein